MQRSATLSFGPAPAASRRETKRVYPFIRWSLYLFAFLMPLETVDLFGSAGFFSITKMAGMLFAVLAFLQPNLCLAFPPRAFWCFVAYMLANLSIGLFYPPPSAMSLAREMLTLGQSILMFWLCYNLMRNDKVAKWALLAYTAGTVVVCMLLTVGIGETVQTSSQGERVSGLGANANISAYSMSVAVLILLGLTLGRAKVRAIWAVLPYPLCMLVVYQLVRTGSRGGLLCLVVGIAVLLFRGGKFSTRLKVSLIAGVVLAGGARAILSSETAMTRLQSTMDTGELAGREQISPKPGPCSSKGRSLAGGRSPICIRSRRYYKLIWTWWTRTTICSG